MSTGLSLNHLVSADEDRVWDRETEGSGGLQVNHQLEFHRLFHRQIAGALPIQNANNVTGGTAEIIRHARAIGDQTTRFGIFALWIDAWEPVCGSVVDNQLAVIEEHRVANNDQRRDAPC